MPRTPEQCEELRSLMRERILRGATRCFAINGYAGTRVSDLARSISIGQGTLYNYFTSKEDVFHAILENSTAKNSGNFHRLKESPLPARDKIAILSQRMLEHIASASDTAFELVLNFRMGEESGADNPFTREYGSLPTDVLSDIISAGQREGTVIEGDTRLLADFYWSVVHSQAVMKIVHRNQSIIPREWLMRLLLRDTESI